MTPGSDQPQPSAAESRPRSPRMHRRARNHQSAHAESTTADDSYLLDNALVPRGQASLVTTPSQLSELCQALRAATSFAYDSEFIGEQSYIPKLCLIQVALPHRVDLIDPLAGLDLMPFWELICDPAVEKIVHAGQQDVEPVLRLSGCRPANLFDTQIAAGLVGLPYPLSLSKLVYEFVGARLGKGLTFTSWDERPLSNQQLRYAADDVRYLPAARQELARRLESAGHAVWAKEESEELCHAPAARFNPDETYLKIRGASALDPRHMAVLRELTIWRDEVARAADVPPRTYLRDEVLLALARSPARDVEKLSRVRGLPRQVESSQGASIVAATQKAFALPDDQLPQQQYSEPSPREKFQCDSLWASSQAHCFNRGIDPALVSSRQEISEFHRRHTTGATADDMRLLTGWRRAALGEKLLDLIRQPSTAKAT